MEFGFFFSYIEEVGEHAELGFDCYGTERAEQRGNIFGGVLGLHPSGESSALALDEILGYRCYEPSIFGFGVCS